MSEGDVSLIHDEDLLRRMWQQTEDFSRKKEIRAHMYRLREERLRNLYSPDPKHEGKGSEFMATQDHVKSFADQTFQSMKSKEVRDAGSPPKEFSYHGQDLKALSNAGWNVEQENKTTDDGHTHVKSVHANIEGRYDVDGGKGQFAAVDHHKEAVTEYHDDNSSLKRNETSSNTAAREHVVRTTDDGTQISSTTSSSTSTSKFQQMSSTTNEPVPYLTNDDYELRKYDTSNENQSSVIRRHVTKANDFEQNVRSNDFKQESRKNDYDETIRRNDYETGELVARKVDYPDDNTRVVVETRCLPDGTRVTSTKREFRVPAQTTQSEHSYQTRSENKSYSTHQRSDSRDSSQIKRHVINKNDDRFTNIVDSQRNIDDYDFKRQTPENTLKNNDVETTVHKNVHTKSNDDYSKVQHYVTTNKTTDNVNQYRNDQAVHKKVINHSEFDKDSTVQRHDTKTTKRTVDDSKTNDDSNQSIQHKTTTQNITKSADNEDYIQNVRDTQYSYYDSNDQRENVTVRDNRTVQPKYYIDVQNITDNQPKESRPKDIETNNHQPIYPPRDTEERTYLARDSKIEEIVEKSNNTEQYHTTYQTDYSQKKVSNDWSPSHTAWASTLRADTPSTTRPSTRASSPGSKTYKSSTSSLRSSVSPDKTHRKPLSRGGSPSKIDRSSPVRTISDRHSTKYSATHSLAETKSMKNSSPERRVPTDWSPTRTTYSPERKLQEHPQRSSASPEKRPQDLPYKPRESPDRKTTPKIPIDSHTKKVSPHSPQERHYSPTETRESRTRSSVSPDKTSFIRDSTPNSNPCPDRKSSNQVHLDGYPGVVPDDARTVSPTRGSKMLNASPNPKSVHAKMTDKPSDKSHQSAPKRGSMSPNRKLDYRPTSPSQLSDNAKSPNKPLDMSSSTMHVEIPSTTHSLKDTITTTKFKQDHYKFIDEETKMYTRPDKTETDFRKSTSTRIASPTVSKQESSSPSRKSPSKDSNNITKEPERDSPSTTYNDTISDKYDSTIKNSTVFDDTDTLYEPTKFDDDKTNTERELSPSKFGTYEKKKPHTIKNSTTSTKTSTTTKDRSSTENLTLHKKSSTSPNEEFDDIKRTSTSSPYSPTLKCKSPSPSRMNSQKNFGDIPTLRERESPSRNSTVKTSDVADHITATHLIRKEKEDTSPNDKISTSRETSPSKFGTYDKKKPLTKTTDVITTVIANESLSHPEKSQTKTAGKPESPTKKIPDLPISPNKKTIDQKRSPTRNKLQDASSPTKDLKHKVTTDFLITERTTEEINKTTTNQRPRQLQTPSSSPTRKLNKPIDNEPSTGQSSPTTSVSGFVYFSSPRNNDSVVTDLDDHENQNILIEQITDETMIAIERPQSLDVKRPPSPSKIPCRSPSPEKHIPHTNGSLPRKSSLKKPSGEVNQSPSIEKPPSSFYISPTEESKILPGHKTLKKDRPEESQMKTPTKTKPPLVRRETYEDRCRKILGMTDEISETSKQTSYFNEAEVNISSPMMARSPGLNFKKTPIESLNTTQVNTKVDTSDFISREQENNINTSRVNESCTKISQPLRDDLPRNLQNMVTKEKRVTDYDVSTNDHEESDFERRQSIDRKILYQHSDDLITKPEKPKTKLNETERPKSQVQKVNEYDESSSPAKLHPGSSPRTSMSPERKPANERKEKSSTKESTDKTLETTTTVSSKYDIINKTQEITVTTKSMPIKPSHIRPESPTKINSKQTATRPSHSNRQRESKQHEKIDHLNEKSLTKPICLESTISMVAQYGSTEELAESDTKSDKSKLIGIQTQKSPVRKSSKSLDEPANASDKNLVREPSYTGQRTESPVKKPQEERKGSFPTRSGYMKTTTSVTSKQESIDNYNSNITESTKRKTSQPKKSKSPTRMDIPQDSDKSPERKPGGRYPSPTKTNLDTKTDDKYFNFPSSESHDKPEKIPGYMKTTESVSSKYDNHTHESKTTTQYHIPRSQSPPHQHGKDDTPHYMQPIQPHQHIHETTATFEDEYETHEITHNSLTHKSPNKQIPHYMEPISSHIHKHETITSEDKDEIYTLSTIENKHTSSRDSPIRRSSKEQSPERRPSNQQPIQPTRTPTKKIKYDSNSEDSQENEEKISVGIQNKTHRPSENSPTRKVAELNNECPRIESSFKRPDSFNKKQSKQQDSPTKKPVSSSPSNRSESSPDRKSHYMKTDTSVILEQDTAELTEKEKTERTSSSKEPSRRSPAEFYETQAPKQLRTPSPTKQTTKVTEISTDFLMSEREQNILDRVQKSLRKLSPERKGKLPSPERSPVKTTTARVQDMDTITLSRNDDEVVTDVFTEFKQKDSIQTNVSEKPKTEKSKDLNVPRKLSSRNVSPAKKSSGNSGPTKLDKNLEPSTKHRSISPKKSNAPFERPQSPHSTKTSGIKPKEQIPSNLTRKPTPATLKLEKSVCDLKKVVSTTTKQNSITKTMGSKSTTKTIDKSGEPRVLISKGSKEIGISPRNDRGTETKVSRTVSDITITTKKISTSPQRVKSKPEIQINNMTPTKTSSKIQKSSLRENQSKLPGKPKSATTLNTPSDEDDIIIDVQQSKSSRENSPDRICPTPVNFVDDNVTPRYPDEVNEPDDDFRRHTHHTIHETESIVDDIVEICEDDELFVRKSNAEQITENDESLLSVTDKVSRFTNATTIKPKDTTSTFKDTERRVHSDFTEKTLNSDDCLLSVSEKVNKFAKGPRDAKEKSPVRKVFNEYDNESVYTDDYTKLSVHDKAHLFVETAENVKTSKVKQTPQKVQRPDLTNIDEALKSDDCLLSVSDKVHKFVKTAEQFLTETIEVEEKEKKIREQHEKIMKKIVDEVEDISHEIDSTMVSEVLEDNFIKTPDHCTDMTSFAKALSSKNKDSYNLNQEPKEKIPAVKITTLRSSEAVKKAKALFENIASTTPKSKEPTRPKTITKLTDIGVMKKSPKTDPTTILHPGIEDISPDITDIDHKANTTPQYQKDLVNDTLTKPQQPSEKPRASPSRRSAQSPDSHRPKSPTRNTTETTMINTLEKHSTIYSSKTPQYSAENDKLQKVPGYLRPTKTSQIKEETKVFEETEVSSRRGSGKFGVELRRTSVERSTTSSERRRSVEHPCIEDIFDLDLLEQMLEKVVGYEQRRRIRAQIRIARKTSGADNVDSLSHTKKYTKQTTINQKAQSPERHQTRSPERTSKLTSHKTASLDRNSKTPQKTITEGSPLKEPVQPLIGHPKQSKINEKRHRPQSPEKSASKTSHQMKIPTQPVTPDKKTSNQSPSKTATKPKANRFNDYASAYMKKVGLNEIDKLKFDETKKQTAQQHKTTNQTEHKIIDEYSTSKSFTERTSSKDTIEVIHVNGSKRSPSPEKRLSPERKQPQNPEKIYERSPSPIQTQPVHHTRSEPAKKETIIKTVYDIEKKIPQKKTQEDKPSWITNRNLKKITSETRTFSSKKLEEKPKYRAPSPSKAITKPIDVITSSYGPGPLDADGKPLFGIKALRNGASNFQVKGTVIRQEYHSRNGGEPEGSVSVTAYSTEPEELERLLQRQGAELPSRIHGLSAITTTKKFGGETGTTLKEIHGKEERAAIDQFTHSDRRVSDTRVEDITESFTSRQQTLGESKRIETRREEIVENITRDSIDNKTEKMQKRVDKLEKKAGRVDKKERPDDKKNVRQSSVKSLTEKYIKNTNESSKSEKVTYPKAGLILRTTAMKDSVSSDSSAHAGLARTDSEHSLGSVEDSVMTTERCDGYRTVTTTRTQGHQTHVQGGDKSFLDSNTKVTGVQDILTRMKNADIVIQDGDSTEDTEARALLNKFLGATVLMAGMQSYVTEKPTGKVVVKQETVRTTSSGGGKVSSTQSRSVHEFDIEQCWDERLLRKLLDECTDYEQRRRVRARIRTLMAEQEACASAVTEALAAAGETPEENNEAREEEEVTVTSSVRRDSSDKTVSSSTTTTKTTKVIESMTRTVPKPVSPFAKFRQLEKQNSTNSPNSPSPKSPGSPAPYFKFTEPALQASAVTIKERLLQWCRDKTRDYENVKLENFSTSWADGLAFCALIHHFLPDAFDYSKLSQETRRHNFTLAFKIADEKAGIYPLLDVDDMVAMRKPDWKCVFTYVQSIHRRFKDQD